MDANLLLANAEYRELKKTTDAQEKRIAALVALVEQKDAEIARLQRIGASAAAVMEDNDEELKRLRNLSTGVVAAAYERGAREFAEMLANTWPDRVLRLVCEEGSFNGRTVKREVVFDADVFLCRFLASRGTGIAESKGGEG